MCCRLELELRLVLVGRGDFALQLDLVVLVGLLGIEHRTKNSPTTAINPTTISP